MWLFWSSAFLVPWVALYLASPTLRKVMWQTSVVTALFGLTEPLFVPAYWNPPSLFELAQRTGFDIESLIFAFAIGGIGTVLYETLTRRHLVPVSLAQRTASTHRLHRWALLVPFVAFGPLFFLPWNPIYVVLASLVLGAIASLLCRPQLGPKTLIGGLLFLGLYVAFMLGLKWFAPGYITAVWNLRALGGGLVYGIPVEELLFGFAFGLYWSGAYDHFTWSEEAPVGRTTRS
ncbi:MAG: lycopene cyclase domain-containing protein [Gammaproteobacteria bacterium]